jgi:c-di-GMP phosphodiesterase
VLQLLSAITNHQNDFKAIAAALAGEPSLSYRLMKMVNSTAFGARRRVESLNQAIALAGLERIRNWATLLLLAGNHQKPTELCTLSSARAKFCEKLASHTANIDPQQAFTLGLLSMLDAHLDLSMATILQHLHLSPSLENALLGADSSGLSLLLKTCAALESQRFSDLPLGSLRALGIDETHINSAYTEALCFADQFNRL